jgi:predicted RNA-binding Zn-ribbon protein involved in translation (DUF1610 family)
MSDKTDIKPKHDIHSFPCSTCGIVFGISREITDLWQKNHHKFVCPNGHLLNWDESNVAEKELNELKAKLKATEEKLEEAKKEAKVLRTSVETLQNELEIWKPSSAKKDEAE